MSSEQESFAIENPAWKQVDPILAYVTAPKDGFFVSIHVSTSQGHESSVFSFHVKRDMLISSPLIASQLLSHTNIPVESQTKEFTQSISNFANNMSSTLHELIIPYHVVDDDNDDDDDDDDTDDDDDDDDTDNDDDDDDIIVEHNDYISDTDMEEYGSDDDDDDDDDDDIIVEDEKDGVRPASKESIEALEKVIINEGLGSMEICSVCLDEFEIGLEATCMPCLHVYHTDCIVEWLEKSNLCPLCRYEMPC